MLSAVLSRRSAPSALARVRAALPHRTHALARAVRSAGPWRSAASGARVALLSTDAGAPAAAKPCCAAKAAAANAAASGAANSAPSHKASNTTVSAAASPEASSEAVSPYALTHLKFWSDASVWRRAAVNTLHCLVGCSIGDLGAVYALSGSTLSMPAVMGIAMASGVTTSLALETLRLRFGRDAFGWSAAASTAARMSLLSMLTMEAAENAVTLWLGGGGGGMLMGDPSTLQFWVSLTASLSAGFLAPLPYNYYALKRYRRSCH